MKSGSPLSFPVCSNKVKSGRFIEILWAFLIKQLFHSRLLECEMIIANSYPTRSRGIIVKCHWGTIHVLSLSHLLFVSSM